MRAFRVDKTTLAALEATLMLYRDPELAARTVPTLRMLRESADAIEERARALCPTIAAGSGVTVEVRRTEAVVGGGAFPGFRIESAGWEIRGLSAKRLATACRAGEPPLIGRIEQDAFIVDLRTLDEEGSKLASGLLARTVERMAEGADA